MYDNVFGALRLPDKGCILPRELSKIERNVYWPNDQCTNVKCIEMVKVKCTI